MKRRESEKVSYLEKNMSELKKEIDEYKSSSSNKIIVDKKIEIESSSESESETETSATSSSASSDSSESDSASINNNNTEQNNKFIIEKIKNSERIIKENKEKLVDEYYKKHYASKIDMLKKGLGAKN